MRHSLKYARKLGVGVLGAAIASILGGAVQAAVVIPTNFGSGADATLTNDSNSSSTATHGTSTSFEVRQDSGTRERVGYIRFDLSGITGDRSGATITLNLTSNTGNRVRTLSIYGLTDSNTDDKFSESALTYNSAPGVTPPATNGDATAPVFDSRLTLLGTVATPASVSAFTTTTANLNLDSFLAADTNNLVTFAIISSNDASADYNFTTKEGDPTGALSPRLTLPNANAVPEPASLAMVGLGGLTLLRRRRA